MGMRCELFIVPADAARALRANPATIHDLLESLAGSEAVVSLEKSWHGLHYLLTGSVWEGDPPLNFLAGGGEAVGGEDEDVGYGPARLLGPPAVRELHEALSQIPDEEFERRFDPEALAAAEVYPDIWDEPLDELRSEYSGYWDLMKTRIRRAAESGQALLVVIG